MSFQINIAGSDYSSSMLKRMHPNKERPDYFNEILSFLHEYWNDRPTVKVSTSGSTGKPKEIELSKSAMRVSASATYAFFMLDQIEKLVLCSPLSAGFIAGKMMLVRALEWDAKLICLQPDSTPLAQIDSPVDFMVMTPHQLSMSLKKNLQDKFRFVKKVLLGGSPINKKLEEQIQMLSGNYKIGFFLGYGMTETMSHVAVKHLSNVKSAAIYRGVKGVKFELDHRGCLKIIYPELLDSVLVTNDVVRLVDTSSFEWLGRIDNVINSGGIKIFPEQVERKLMQIINIPFYVSSIPDNELGEKIVIYIESVDKVSLAQLKQRARKTLTKYEMPKIWRLVDAFNYTKNNKILNLELYCKKARSK